ncbi:MAG: hypothetical protein HeimC3_27440 [Candidatus Heimdallarchaeota archaeon LC_3]|nr:MAG: hypothetical protein HeimC3_27440 [Candidatus Heimdallarchaeota archaeon LC_3]
MESECELCGIENPFVKKYLIEGAEVNACPSCGKFGKPVQTLSRKSYSKTSFRGSSGGRPPPNRFGSSGGGRRSGYSPPNRRKDEAFLVENFGTLIQQTRERLGLTRKDVSESLFIRENLLARVESGKIRPKDDLIKKLEKILEIKLVEDSSQTTVTGNYNQKDSSNQSRTLTLGDFARIRKKKNK